MSTVLFEHYLTRSCAGLPLFCPSILSEEELSPSSFDASGDYEDAGEIPSIPVVDADSPTGILSETFLHRQFLQNLKLNRKEGPETTWPLSPK